MWLARRRRSLEHCSPSLAASRRRSAAAAAVVVVAVVAEWVS